MIIVERGNVVLRVADNLLEHYVSKGYTAKTLDGKILKEAIPTDIGVLRKAYIENKKEIQKLKDEIAELKRSKSPIVSDTSDDKPKRTRAKKTDE